MTKNVLLIYSYAPLSSNVKNRHIPLGLMYIASTLIELGYTVKLKDLYNETVGMKENEINNYLNTTFIKYLKIANPDFVGIGVPFSPRLKPALKVAKIVKTVFDDIPVVLGGTHITLFPQAILEEYAYIDYAVLGEGEQSIVKLLNAHSNNKNLLSEIDGIAYRKDGKVVVNPKTNFIKDLDNIPFPAYHLINLKDYYFDTSDWHNPKKLPINYNFPIITSRGCPKRCTYCLSKLLYGTKYRMRSAKSVVDEIQYLYDRYNCRYISFVDDNMAVSKKRTLKIMSEICKRELNIQFDTSNGLAIDTLDEEIMAAMAKAGHIRTAVGIETGSEYMRNAIVKKNLKDETIYNFFEMARKYKDLRIVAYFMCGFPQETKETLNDTFEMIKRLLPLDGVAMSIMIPFYGTEMFRYCYEQGLLKNVDIKDLHNLSGFSFENGFLIKPFKLDISYIRDFRNKVLEYVRDKRLK
jgi:magnesium-protoporphyrin IX monomethyl ester (oxidative) cyclase